MNIYNDEEFFKHYNCIWSKLCESIKNVLDSEIIYNNKFLKAITRSGKNFADLLAKMHQN